MRIFYYFEKFKQYLRPIQTFKLYHTLDRLLVSQPCPETGGTRGQVPLRGCANPNILPIFDKTLRVRA